MLGHEFLLHSPDFVLVLVGADLLHLLVVALDVLDDLLVLHLLVRQLQLLHVQDVGQVPLQLVALALQPVVRALQLVVEALDLLVPVAHHLLQLGVLDVHELQGLGVVVEDVLQLGLVLAGVGLLDVLDFPVLLDLQLVDVLVELGDLVHQALVAGAVFPHLVAVLLQEPVLLELDLLQGLHLLGDLLLQLLLQGDYDAAAVVQQVGQLVVLRQQELVLLHQHVQPPMPHYQLVAPLLLRQPRRLLPAHARLLVRVLLGDERVAQLRLLRQLVRLLPVRRYSRPVVIRIAPVWRYRGL